MFIDAETLWNMDRAAEISSAERRGEERGEKRGEERGEIKNARQMILRVFARRFPEQQNSPELKRRLKLEKSLDALMEKFDLLLMFRPDATFEEALGIL